MSQVKLFRSTFQFSKQNPAGQAGPVFAYKRPVKIVALIAASAHPADIIPVINSNFSGGPGESLELISAFQEPGTGTEGNVIYS